VDYGFIPNLHVILLGDSQRAGAYLPYGKQLVRQLLASRQPYGKRVVSPEEGILVEAWVSDDHRWVRVTAGGCPQIFMDSGAIGLQNIGLHNPALTGQDGTLHYNDGIRAYVPEEKLLGALRPPSVASGPSVELDASKAFAATIDADGNRDPESESQLAYKKYCAATAPPSVFTGKLRLYFQAQYGTKLGAWKFQINEANHPPSLDWTTTLEDDGYAFQFRSTTTGIYTDSEKRHWLIQLGVKGATATPNQMNVFKMKTTQCVEKLRPLLRSDDVSADDKERIETYILSQSYPDPAFCISKPVTIPLSYSLGYGWHFNWGGTAADIVQIEAIDLGGSAYKYRSTHWRIAVDRNETYVDDPSNTELENEDRRWGATLEQVEQAEWKNYKWQHVIASPDWETKQLEILGALLGDRFGAAAPFYAFYTRDELNVLRYSCSGGSSIPAQYKSEAFPTYFGGVADWGEYAGYAPAGSYVTTGDESGEFNGYQRTATDLIYSFSVGGATVSGLDFSYGYTRKTRSVSPTFGGEPYYGEGTASLEESQIQQGNSVPNSALGVWGNWTGGETWESWTTIPASRWDRDAVNGAYATLIEDTDSGTYSKAGVMLCVIPFGDSEAAYLWSRDYVSRTGTGTHRHHEQITNFFNSMGWRPITVPSTPTVTYLYWGRKSDGGYGGTTTATSTSEEAYVTTGAHFISGNGVQSFDPDSATVVSAFFAGEPTTHVPQQFHTRTSAGLYRDTDGAGAAITGGYDVALDGKPYVFTGWA
jgi:hypothetical protein